MKEIKTTINQKKEEEPMKKQKSLKFLGGFPKLVTYSLKDKIYHFYWLAIKISPKFGNFCGWLCRHMALKMFVVKKHVKKVAAQTVGGTHKKHCKIKKIPHKNQENCEQTTKSTLRHEMLYTRANMVNFNCEIQKLSLQIIYMVDYKSSSEWKVVNA